MKTWEMIKELTEHPEKVFRSIFIDGYKKVRARGNSDQIIVEYANTLGVTKTVYILDDDWQEVKETVGWNEALGHMRKGGKAKYNNGTYCLNNCLLSSYEDGVYYETVLTEYLLDSKEWELL